MKTIKTLVLLAAVVLMVPPAVNSQSKDVGRDVLNQLFSRGGNGNSRGNRAPRVTTPAPSAFRAPRSNSGKVKEMTYDEFVKRFPGVKGDGKSVVVVDIGADWCTYCRKLEPVMDELARKYKGRVEFYRIDSEKNPEIGSLLGISGIPHVLIFPKNGEPEHYEGFPTGADPVSVYSTRIERQM